MARTLAEGRLPRAVYRDFWWWDEAPHDRQFDECWNRGGISIIEIDGARIGMIQLFDQPDPVEVGEIQIQPSYQKEGIGSRVLQDTLLTPTSKGGRSYSLSP